MVVSRDLDGWLQCSAFIRRRRIRVDEVVVPSEARNVKRARRTSAGKPGPAWLPGDPAPSVEAMIRVDQAGEYGAVRIYEGQLAVLPHGPARDAVVAMAKQERRHLETFDRLMVERRVRPTLLAPVWHFAGYVLGAVTARLGERAAMACTVAVEEVIDRHYADQSLRLGPEEAEFRRVVEDFRADELEHRETAISHDAHRAPAYPVLTALVKAASRLAIRLSTRY